MRAPNVALRSLCMLLAAAGLLGLAGCSSDDVKPAEPTALKSLDNPRFQPQEIWSSDAGSGTADISHGFRIAQAGGSLYVADPDGRISAFSATTGERQWRRDLDTAVESGPGVAGLMLAVGTRNGQLLVLNRINGKDLWKTQLSGEALAPPAGDEVLLVARSLDGRSYGFKPDGSRSWSFDRSVPTLTLRGMAAAVLESGRVYLGMDNGKLASVDAESGQILWETPVSVPTGRSELERIVDVDTEPVLAAGKVFAVSYAGDLVALATQSGAVVWKQNVGSGRGLASNGAQVFAVNGDGAIKALSTATGAVQWTNKDLLYRHVSSPVLQSGMLVVGDMEGYLHWLDPATGKIVARTRLFHQAIIVPPLSYAGRVYVLGDGGTLAAIEQPKLAAQP